MDDAPFSKNLANWIFCFFTNGIVLRQNTIDMIELYVIMNKHTHTVVYCENAGSRLSNTPN